MTQFINSTRYYHLLCWLLLLVALAVACTSSPNAEPLPTPPLSLDTTVPTSSETAVVSTVTPIAPATNNDQSSTEPTPTPAAEATATTMPQSPQSPITPITQPPIQAVTDDTLPATSRDLLFIADGAFKQWTHQSQQIETIIAGAPTTERIRTNPNINNAFVGDVTGYMMSADGKRAVVAQLTQIVPVTRNVDENNSYEDNETSHQLLFVDMISREIWTLVPQIDNLHTFALSPDAKQLAFISTGTDGVPEQPSQERASTHLFSLATGGGNPEPIRQPYSCQLFCFSLVWHPESNLLTFADDDALWLYNIAAQAPEPLLENTPFDYESGSIEDVAVYSPIDWAQNGRFLLTLKGGWEGGPLMVLDVPTGILVEVPDAGYGLGPPTSEVMWMPDDRLFILRAGYGNGAPTAELWRLQPDTADLTLEESLALSTQDVVATGQQYLEDGRFAFGLISGMGRLIEEPHQQAVGTYLLTSLNETPERVNAIPTFGEHGLGASLYWASDGSGAIVVQTPHPNTPTVYYGGTNGDYLYDVSAALGAQPHDFYWQPEIIVP